ncbi:MAG TPA: ABC transporter substrate-binding protein [Burkholderiaceae bacterium]|nr:ABC transporter substrate-binding protein [Burkholderiaceae bacterium]
MKRAFTTLAISVPGVALAATLRAVLLQPADDARLERTRVERAYLGHPTGSAADGLKVALDEARFELDAAGAAVSLEVAPVADTPEAAREAARKAAASGAAVLLTDLSAAATAAAADAAPKLPVLNVGNAADALRERDCRANLWHTLPSERMRADALAQWLVSRKWSSVLLLAGPGAADAARTAAAQASLRRYGLKVVATRPFKLSADPRERDLANPLLLTGGGLAHDAIWVVDSDGEFARALPYRTALPRPVVGDAGLVALAWHAQFDRFGAPQVVRRFAKAHGGRAMTAHDWAAWIAGRALTAAAVASPKGPWSAASFAPRELDGSKGVALSFRAWDGQLRQTMLLTDGQGVVGSAPVDGLLHPRNMLDTLGADAPEKLCKARP